MSVFLQAQKARLQKLIQSIPPAQRAAYVDRVRDLEEKIERREKLIKHPEQIKAIKKQLDTDQKLNQHIDSSGANVFTNITRLAKANASSVPKEISDKAILTRASTIFKRTGKMNTEAFLSAHGLDGYEILPESTESGLVLKAPNGKVKVAFRGTLVPESVRELKTSAGDVSADFAYFTGFESRHPVVKSDDALMRDVTQKYDVDELLGFSLGGAKTHTYGEKYGINTTSFNPLVGQTFINSGESNVNHTIWRTTEDMPSSGVALIDRENVKVNSVYPLKNYSSNPKRTHDLENMISSESRTVQSNIKRLSDLSVSKGQRLSEYGLLDDMLENKDKSFTEWLHSYNRGGNGTDTSKDGQLLDTVRLSDKTAHGKLWKKIGGSFTDAEQAIFDNGTIPAQDTKLSSSEIDAYIHNDDAGRKAITDSSMDALMGIHGDLDEAIALPMEVRQGGVDRSASLLTGLLASSAASYAVSAGEKATGKQLTEPQRAAAVGGLGGIGGELGVAGLSGVAATGLGTAGAIGAVSSVAGQKAEQAASRFGASRFISGEVGGATSGGLAGALATGAAAGAEAGLPLDIETVGGASLLGAGIGAGLSALGYGLHRLGVNV
jgi:hypothetical protein